VGDAPHAAARDGLHDGGAGYTAAQIAAQLGHADGGVLALRTYVHADMIEPDFVDEALSG
jgi:hypothetical protein